MKLLDLFCGAGGAATGYAKVGFTEITGVDIECQKHYPYYCIVGDFRLDDKYLRGFDLIHASPPCQRYSIATKKENRNKHPDLIEPVRELLIKSGRPFVIENVGGARHLLKNPIMLCGTMFGLGVFRHRYFETNFPLSVPDHKKHDGKIGDGKYFSVAGGSGRWKSWGTVYRNVSKGTVKQLQKAMGIDWMTRKELNEAIPPAYTEWIGLEFLKQRLQRTELT